MQHLAIYNQAKKAIAEYKTVDEVKDFRDKALAVEAYAKQAKDFELEHDAAVARVRAERKAGELLAEMEMAKGVRMNGGGESPVVERDDRRENTKTLSEMGITKDQSSKWQQLAEVPEKEFEEVVSQPAINKDGKRTKISTNKILNPDLPSEPKPRMDQDALWFWGLLRDMRKRGVFDIDPNILVSEWTDAMKEDAECVIPQLKAWINTYE